MKIKVIDLLNKIAKGEEVPKKIKYQGDIYSYNENENVYEGLEECVTLMENVYECDLNDEIEILEEVEDKEYEDIEEIKRHEDFGLFILSPVEEVLVRKIDALIRNQKKILERIESGYYERNDE